jgi:energy-converting hydrogenase Eha subunit G
MTPEANHRPPPLRRSYGLGATLAAIALFLAFAPFQTQDGPNHRQVATLVSQLVDSGGEDAVYRTNLGALTTNQLFPVGFARVASPTGMSVELYERIFVALFLILLVWGYRQFLSEWAPHAHDLWVWCLPLVGHALFVTGMYNFLAATALTFPALVFLRRTVEGESTSGLVAFSALCWIALVAHPFPFFVLPLAWLWLLLDRGSLPGPRGWTAALVIGGCLALGFVGPMLRGSGPTNPYVFKHPLELIAGLTYYNFPAFSVGHALASVPALAAAVVLIWKGIERGTRISNALWLAMMVGYFVFPTEGHGGAHVNERFLPFAWAFLPLALGPAATLASPWRSRVKAAAIVSAVLSTLGLSHGFARAAAEVRDAEAVLGSLPARARLYPLEFDPAGPSLTHSPLLHLWSNYAPGLRVYAPYQFTFMDLMPVSRRFAPSDTYFPAAPENLAQRIADGQLCSTADPPGPDSCEAEISRAWRELMGAAAYYDYWFVHAPPEDIRELIASTPGLGLVSEEGRSSLWRSSAARAFLPPLP